MRKLSNIDLALDLNLISAMDYHFASFLGRFEENLDEKKREIFLTAIALLSKQIALGSLCLTGKDLETISLESKQRENGEKKPPSIPKWSEIAASLADSFCCTKTPEKEIKPIVFINDKLYFYKYWKYEFDLAFKLKELIDEKEPEELFGADREKISALLQELFDDPRQLKAAKRAISEKFTIITGGPGTGKTTIIAKILAVILTFKPETRIMLAAPTGKAASRMNEALKEKIKELDKSLKEKSGGLIGDCIKDEIVKQIEGIAGSSIHRLLGWTPRGFSYNSKNRLPADLLILDEASMIDVALISKLFEATNKKTKLIMLGDKDQLLSVEAGNVFGDICEAAAKGCFTKNPVVELTKSYRFDETSYIGRVAKAINASRADEALEILNDCRDGSLTFIKEPLKSKFVANFIKEAILKNYSFLSDRNVGKEELLKRLGNFMILSPSKESDLGINDINRSAEQMFNERREICYHGRPVMVTKNNYELDVFNGECGFIFEENRKKTAVFRGNDYQIKSFPVGILRDIETNYAMTIHKSQGSEYDDIMIILPEIGTSLLTKEILYTAITRAKKHATLIATEEILRYTINKKSERNSGLIDALTAITTK